MLAAIERAAALSVLRHPADGPAQVLLRYVARVLPVDDHAPAFNIMKTQYKFHPRGLARAGSPHQQLTFPGASNANRDDPVQRFECRSRYLFPGMRAGTPVAPSK